MKEMKNTQELVTEFPGCSCIIWYRWLYSCHLVLRFLYVSFKGPAIVQHMRHCLPIDDIGIVNRITQKANQYAFVR